MLACSAGPGVLSRAGFCKFARAPDRFLMTIRVRHLIVLCVAFAALALPAAAQADPDAVVRDCAADGSVDGNYSDSDKRAALKRIPADLDEYSDCRARDRRVDRRRLQGGARRRRRRRRRRRQGPARDPAAAAHGRQAQGAGGEAQARSAARTEAVLGDRRSTRATRASSRQRTPRTACPLPVLLALIALGLLAAAGAVIALGRRNPGLGATLRRVPLPFTRR